MSAIASASTEPIRLTVRANFAWTLAGNIAHAGAQWVLILVLARFASAEVVGAYALALAVASPVFLLANLHLRTVHATDIGEEFSFETYLGLRLLSSAAAACVLLVSAVAGLGGSGGGILAALAIGKMLESLSDLFYGRFQLRERMAHIGKSMILRSMGVVMVMTLALKSGAGVVVGTWACAAVCAAALAFDAAAALSMEMTGKLRLDPDWGTMRRLARRVAPLSLVLLFVSLNANVPRYVLAALAGEREVGVFSALASLAVAANTLVMALGQSTSTRLALSFFAGDLTVFLRKGAVLLLLAVALGAAGITAAIAAGPQLLALLYGSAYAGASKAFRWVMVGGALSYVGAAAGYMLSSARCFTPQLPLLAGATLVTAIVSILLVPGLGVAGAAMGQAAGYLVQMMASFFVLGHWCRKQFAR